MIIDLSPFSFYYNYYGYAVSAFKSNCTKLLDNYGLSNAPFIGGNVDYYYIPSVPLEGCVEYDCIIFN